MKKETGFESIAKERIEQVIKHRYGLDKDSAYKKGELMQAAWFCITLNNDQWPEGWSEERRDHIKMKGQEDRYVIAGAFIAAEVDRMRGIEDRAFDMQAEKYIGIDRLKAFIEKQEENVNHYCSGTMIEKVVSLINYAERLAAGAQAQKKQCVEDMKIYVRAMCMSLEMVSLAGTHGEKAARLRGVIELLNQTSNKLSNGYEDELLQGYRFEMYGNSDKPYQNILRKYDELRRENEQLKKQLNPNTEKEQAAKDLPF